jgi:hypothetical protein
LAFAISRKAEDLNNSLQLSLITQLYSIADDSNVSPFLLTALSDAFDNGNKAGHPKSSLIVRFTGKHHSKWHKSTAAAAAATTTTAAAAAVSAIVT